MKSFEMSKLIFPFVSILIDYCRSETMEEKQNREKYCGVKPEQFSSVLYPWYAALRIVFSKFDIHVH